MFILVHFGIKFKSRHFLIKVYGCIAFQNLVFQILVLMDEMSLTSHNRLILSDPVVYNVHAK